MARELSNIYRVGSLKVITTYFETRRLWSVWSETCIYSVGARGQGFSYAFERGSNQRTIWEAEK